MLTHDKRTPRIVSSCRPFPHQGSVSCFFNLNSNGDFFVMFQCSVSCGEGIRQRNVSCRLASGQFSPGCNEENKPTFREPCNIRPCPTWIIGDWDKVMCHLTAWEYLLSMFFKVCFVCLFVCLFWWDKLANFWPCTSYLMLWFPPPPLSVRCGELFVHFLFVCFVNSAQYLVVLESKFVLWNAVIRTSVVMRELNHKPQPNVTLNLVQDGKQVHGER